MDTELCFICAVKIGRGNRSEIGTQAKMDKLVSVQKTVDHSSTIISDILSRILNETVLREESVCRICFNLLNDIDYHLKEAQEKTDEVTAKFLDKEKDPLKYNPQTLVDPRKAHSKKHRSKVVTTSGGHPTNMVSRTIQTEFKDDLCTDSYRSRSPSHVPVKGGGKGQSFYRSPETKRTVATENIQLVSVQSNARGKEAKLRSPKQTHLPVKGGLAETSGDEMTKNKRRLLSRVLAPSKKTKKSSAEFVPDIDSEDESKLTIDMEEKILRERRRKEKKQRKKEKKQKLLEHNNKERLNQKYQEVLLIDASSDQEQDQNDAEVSPIQNYSTPVQQPMPPATSPQKSKEIRTVDLSQLGDLFSVPVSDPTSPPTVHTIISVHPQSSLTVEDSKIFAKKSVPGPSKPPSMKQSLAEQVEAAPIFILPDQVQGLTAVTSIASMTFQSGQEIPIIDCRPIISRQEKQGEMMGMTMTDLVDVDDSDVDDPTYEPLTDKKEPVNNQPIHKTEQGLNSPQKFVVQQEVKVQVISPGKICNSLLKRHSGIPSIPCPHCPKLFMRGYNMRVHIDRVHNKSKPWQCQYCVKTFATTSDLKQHLSSHGMGKIHKCEDCGREFTNRDSAILHRKQHNNERTHFCTECSKGFFKASCLQRHMRSHTGEKPYSCEFCRRGFSQVTTLKNHKKACKFAGKVDEEPNLTVHNPDQVS